MVVTIMKIEKKCWNKIMVESWNKKNNYYVLPLCVTMTKIIVSHGIDIVVPWKLHNRKGFDNNEKKSWQK